jgi:hypothetical protein
MAVFSLRRQGDFLVVENAGPLARIRAPDLARRVDPRSHQPGAEQTLHVEDVVVRRLPQLLDEPHEPLGPGVALEDVDVVDRFARPHDRGEDFAHDPGNAQMIHLRLQRSRHLQSVHDVAERRGLDDEKVGHVSANDAET